MLCSGKKKKTEVQILAVPQHFWKHTLIVWKKKFQKAWIYISMFIMIAELQTIEYVILLF